MRKGFYNRLANDLTNLGYVEVLDFKPEHRNGVIFFPKEESTNHKHSNYVIIGRVQESLNILFTRYLFKEVDNEYGLSSVDGLNLGEDYYCFVTPYFINNKSQIVGNINRSLHELYGFDLVGYEMAYSFGELGDLKKLEVFPSEGSQHVVSEKSVSTATQQINKEDIAMVVDYDNKTVTKVEQKEDLKEYDFVNPDHYKQFSVEVIDMMVAIYGEEKVADHCEITAFKYKLRMGTKPGQSLERDMDKANWYLNKAAELRSKL